MRLKEIKYLCDATPAGPWSVVSKGDEIFVVGPEPELLPICALSIYAREFALGQPQPGVRSAAFIAAARDLLPKLLDVVEAAKGLRWRGSEEFNPEVIRFSDALDALESLP
jgi:hypothetical protein